MTTLTIVMLTVASVNPTTAAFHTGGTTTAMNFAQTSRIGRWLCASVVVTVFVAARSPPPHFPWYTSLEYLPSQSVAVVLEVGRGQ